MGLVATYAPDEDVPVPASYLKRLDGVNEIQKAVECDLAGNPLASKGDIDAEAVAGVMSYVGARLEQAGSALGLGTMRHLLVQGQDINCVTSVRGEMVISCFLGARSSAVNIQRTMERLLG